jgi:hypothetical protein
MKLPGVNLDPRELNPIHCCVCINRGAMGVKAETIVLGYAVCADHSLALDEAGSLHKLLGRRSATRGVGT